MAIDIDPDVQNRWILGDQILGVKFRITQAVRVVSGQHAGTIGEIVSLYSLGADPIYHVETAERKDFEVKQSNLQAILVLAATLAHFTG